MFYFLIPIFMPPVTVFHIYIHPGSIAFTVRIIARCRLPGSIRTFSICDSRPQTQKRLSHLRPGSRRCIQICFICRMVSAICFSGILAIRSICSACLHLAALDVISIYAQCVRRTNRVDIVIPVMPAGMFMGVGTHIVHSVNLEMGIFTPVRSHPLGNIIYLIIIIVLPCICHRLHLHPVVPFPVRVSRIHMAFNIHTHLIP